MVPVLSPLTIHQCAKSVLKALLPLGVVHHNVTFAPVDTILALLHYASLANQGNILLTAGHVPCALITQFPLQLELVRAILVVLASKLI